MEFVTTHKLPKVVIIKMVKKLDYGILGSIFMRKDGKKRRCIF